MESNQNEENLDGIDDDGIEVTEESEKKKLEKKVYKEPTEEEKKKLEALERKKFDTYLEKYKDPEGLSIKRLNFGLWLMNNKSKIRRYIILFLIVVSIIFWLISIITWGNYLFFDLEADRQIINEVIKGGINHDKVLSESAKKIVIYPQTVLESNGKYDYVVLIENKNNNYYAQFTYYLKNNNDKKYNGFILPGDSKHLLIMSNDYGNDMVIIDNINWSLYSKHEIPDWEDYKFYHLNFNTENKIFTSSQESGLSGELQINKLEFDIINNTPYNYLGVGLNILLYRDTELVGAYKYIVPNFKSSESRNIKLSWAGAIGRVTVINITPDINIMSKDIYIKFDNKGGGEVIYSD